MFVHRIGAGRVVAVLADRTVVPGDAASRVVGEKGAP